MPHYTCTEAPPEITGTPGMQVVSNADGAVYICDAAGNWRNLTPPTNALSDGGEMSIMDGAVGAVMGSAIRVDTQMDAATDDLDTIGQCEDCSVLVVQAAHTDRTVVVEHGTGNLRLAGAADYPLDDDMKAITFIRRGMNWHELARA